jgi:meiosis-specific transcription factor NDT80
MPFTLSNPSSGMAASRSPGLPHLASPTSTRGLYTGPTPQLRRTSDLFSRSPTTSTIRGVPLSPSSSGFTSPTNMENSLGAQASPPLHATEVLYQLQTADGQMIRPEIFGKIDKGFFMADNDWTCYRRNYFSLNCSYTLHPTIPTGTLHVVQPGGSHPQVFEFAISIAAVVDGRDGKAIELVQHTPKRDKGPQDKPSRITLAPRPPPSSLGMYVGDNGLGGSRGLYDQGYGPNSNHQAMEATFERIQFKNATANNGKRRAAQQYYHLLVELFADVGKQHPDRWIKIATRMSAPMVVRGRSPGHYQSERRGSNTSTGPGSGGAGGGGAFSPTGSTSRTPGDTNMGGSSMASSSSYGNSYDTRSHHYRSNIAPLQIPMEPTMSAEEAKSIEEAPGYLYYAAPIWEGNENRYLPAVSEYQGPKLKQEYSSGYTLPSLMHNQDGYGRHCGRWEGVPESKGYFPTALIQQELNIT